MEKPLTMGDIRKNNIKTLMKSITDGTYGGSQRYTSRFTNKDQTDTRAKMMQGLREQMEELKTRIEERENNYTQRSMCYSEDETDDEEDDIIPSNNYRDYSEGNREPYRQPYQTDARTMEKPLTMGDYFHMDRASHGDFNQYRPYESSDSEDDQERGVQSSYGFQDENSEDDTDYPNWDDIPDATQDDEVSSFFGNESIDTIAHEPTPPIYVSVVEDYEQSDEEDVQIYTQEEVDNAYEFLEKILPKPETCQITLLEPETAIVGEIDTYPTTLIIPTKQPFVDFVGMDWDKTEQMDVITDNPPIMDDLNVINNVDRVYEPTANMLSDIAHDWEDLILVDRKKKTAVPHADMFDPDLKSTPESPPPWEPPKHDTLDIQVNKQQQEQPKKRKRLHEDEMILRKKSYFFIAKFKRSLSIFKSKWLGPGDLDKNIPLGARHEVMRNITDCRHTNDPP